MPSSSSVVAVFPEGDCVTAFLKYIAADGAVGVLVQSSCEVINKCLAQLRQVVSEIETGFQHLEIYCLLV